MSITVDTLKAAHQNLIRDMNRAQTRKAYVHIGRVTITVRMSKTGVISTRYFIDGSDIRASSLYQSARARGRSPSEAAMIVDLLAQNSL